MEAKAKTTEGGNIANGDGNKMKRKWTTNDNDLPSAQRSKLRHPKINSYCQSCVFDLLLKYNCKTWKCKKEGHKDYATIKNRMEGLERNCFHSTGKWRYGSIDKNLEYKTTDLNKTLLSVCPFSFTGYFPVFSLINYSVFTIILRHMFLKLSSHTDIIFWCAKMHYNLLIKYSWSWKLNHRH